MRFGWYYEGGGNCCGEGDDLWQLIDEAVSEAACSSLPGQLDKVRVGEMESLSASDMIDADDVLEMVHDRLYDQVEDGTAEADDGFAAALRAVLDEYIELDPSRVCHGRYPLPIEYRKGEWTFGGDRTAEPNEDDEPAAFITYATEPSPETGHIGWCWWALGKMGNAPSLRDAMAAAEEAIRRRRVS